MDGTLPEPQLDLDYQLGDNLTRSTGRIFLTGTQALVRIMLTQRRMDKRARPEHGRLRVRLPRIAAGRRGRPCGRRRRRWTPTRSASCPASMKTWRPRPSWAQQAGMRADRKVDGVFAMWYGKGPGVDRAGDALHHGNAAGASRNGGVLVVVGDDHTAVSSSIPHASEASLIGWQMPIVHPSSIDEYETFALGWALSRHSGAWVAFKAVSETIECGHSFTPAPPQHYDMPADPDLPPEMLEYSARDFLSLAVETRMNLRMKAVAAFARRHSIDKLACPAPKAVAGIVTVGKAHLDTMEALARLGVDTVTANAPVRIYKPGLTWPLDAGRLLEFARGLSHILVIEEKGAVVESQIKDLLFNLPDRPTVIGKKGFDGEALVPSAGQLRPSLLARPLAAWLARAAGLPAAGDLAGFECQAPLSNEADGMRRRPYFCSGCPHSTSTKVPEGSQAPAGRGLPLHGSLDGPRHRRPDPDGRRRRGLDRSVRYTKMPHVFQNMGEGTYYHSGYLAIRQAVAARANITYKILFNDAVATTGGAGGRPDLGAADLPAAARRERGPHRRHLRRTREIPGRGPGRHPRAPPPRAGRAAARTARDSRRHRADPRPDLRRRKRRRRKKNQFPDPARRMLINSAVCEGCGDCGVQSNCLSVVPLETPYGRKRAIDQSSCNKDYSCAEGFCPSFVSVMGGKPKKSAAPKADQERLQQLIAQLPAPAPAALDRPYRLLVAGMGGTGVITIGAIISMAAHLEGLSAAVLDLTGLAQKAAPWSATSGWRRPAPSPAPCDWTGSRPTPPSCATRWPRWRRTRWALRHGHTRSP